MSSNDIIHCYSLDYRVINMEIIKYSILNYLRTNFGFKKISLKKAVFTFIIIVFYYIFGFIVSLVDKFNYYDENYKLFLLFLSLIITPIFISFAYLLQLYDTEKKKTNYSLFILINDTVRLKKKLFLINNLSSVFSFIVSIGLIGSVIFSLNISIFRKIFFLSNTIILVSLVIISNLYFFNKIFRNFVQKKNIQKVFFLIIFLFFLFLILYILPFFFKINVLQKVCDNELILLPRLRNVFFKLPLLYFVPFIVLELFLIRIFYIKYFNNEFIGLYVEKKKNKYIITNFLNTIIDKIFKKYFFITHESKIILRQGEELEILYSFSIILFFLGPIFLSLKIKLLDSPFFFLIFSQIFIKFITTSYLTYFFDRQYVVLEIISSSWNINRYVKKKLITFFLFIQLLFVPYYIFFIFKSSNEYIFVIMLLFMFISLLSIISFFLVLKFKISDNKIVLKLTTLGLWIYNLSIFMLMFINIGLLYLFNVFSLTLKIILSCLIVLGSIIFIKLFVKFVINIINKKGNEILIK